MNKQEEQPKKYYTKSERERFKEQLKARFGDQYKTKEEIEAEKRAKEEALRAKYGDQYKTKEEIEAHRKAKEEELKERYGENYKPRSGDLVKPYDGANYKPRSGDNKVKPRIGDNKDKPRSGDIIKPNDGDLIKSRIVANNQEVNNMGNQSVNKLLETTISKMNQEIQREKEPIKVIIREDKPQQKIKEAIKEPIKKQYDSNAILESYENLKKQLYDKHEALKKVFNGYRNLYAEARSCQDPKANIYWDRMNEVKELAEDCQRRLNETPHESPKIIEINQKYKSEPYADLRDIDVAYLRKHNELMNLYKAYNILVKKVKEYKDRAENFKSLEFKSVLSQEQLDQMIIDQRKAMVSLSKIQNNLFEDGILEKDEMVNFKHIGPIKVEHFNNQLMNQLDKLGDKKVFDADNLNKINTKVIDEKTKEEIRKILNDSKLDPKEKVNKIIVLGKK